MIKSNINFQPHGFGSERSRGSTISERAHLSDLDFFLSLFPLPRQGCTIYNWPCASKSFYQESVLIFITEELKPVPDNLEISGEL